MLVYLQHFINFSLLPFPIYEIIFSDFLCQFAISSSTLGNYEKDENIDMSLGNLMTLANFYNVSTDYLLCRTELRQHKNQSVSDLHLNDDAIQILTDKKYNPRLLSELLTHENFKKFMTDLKIYIDGFNDKGLQIANSFQCVHNRRFLFWRTLWHFRVFGFGQVIIVTNL